MTTQTVATWVLDPSHSLAEFSVKHMMIATVKGRFRTFSGTIQANPADLTSAQFQVTIDMASIDTADTQRDDHLRSADFFEAEKHPQMSFQSKGVSAKGDEYQLTGDLTIRGVTKEVSFDLTYEGQGKDPWGNERIAFSAETKINRKDFGLNWNTALEAGGVLVGEQVKIAVHLEAIKQAA